MTSRTNIWHGDNIEITNTEIGAPLWDSLHPDGDDDEPVPFEVSRHIKRPSWGKKSYITKQKKRKKKKDMYIRAPSRIAVLSSGAH